MAKATNKKQPVKKAAPVPKGSLRTKKQPVKKTPAPAAPAGGNKPPVAIAAAPGKRF